LLLALADYAGRIRQKARELNCIDQHQQGKPTELLRDLMKQFGNLGLAAAALIRLWPPFRSSMASPYLYSTPIAGQIL
jgi:hypothetical protein